MKALAASVEQQIFGFVDLTHATGSDEIDDAEPPS
jgi:hypothetical protein